MGKEQSLGKMGSGSVILPFVPFLTLIILVTALLGGVSCIYPKDCEVDEECDLEDKLCHDGLCICDIDEHFQHDRSRDKCVKLAGHQCRFEGNETLRVPESWLDCVENGLCSSDSGLCECETGYEMNKFHDCKKGFGASCERSEECNYGGFLVCSRETRTCECNDPKSMSFDPTRKTCVALLDTHCELQEFMGMRKDCVRNAECVKVEHEDSEYFGVCECRAGFRNLSSLLCVRLYGEECDSDSDCVTGLCAPSSGRCDCPRPVVSSSLEQQLMSLSHSVVPLIQPLVKTLLSSYCDVKVGGACQADGQCSMSATCHPSSSICTCPSGFSATSEGGCEPSTTTTTTTTATGSTWKSTTTSPSDSMMMRAADSAASTTTTTTSLLNVSPLPPLLIIISSISTQLFHLF